MNSPQENSCPICNEQISEADAVCPHCGALIEEPAYDAISDEEDG